MAQLQATLILLARILLGLPFVVLGGALIPYWQRFVDALEQMQIPAAPIFVGIASLFFILGGVCLILGYKARIGAILLIVALACTLWTVGNVWDMSSGPLEPDPWAMWNNLALFGGLLYVLTFGSGGFSLDSRKQKD